MLLKVVNCTIVIAQHIKPTLTNVHATKTFSTFFKLLLCKSLELKRLHASVCSLLGLQFLTISSCFGKTVLIDLSIEWLAFTLGLLESLLLYLLLLMLRCFILESVLMEHFILAFTGIKAISKAVVVLQFLKHRCFGIFSTHSLVFNFNLVQSALINQSLILVVSDLTLFTSFELLPSLFFDHCSICIKVLSLKSNLLQLLSQSSLLFSLSLFLLFNLSMNLKKAFFTSCLCSLS